MVFEAAFAEVLAERTVYRLGITGPKYPVIRGYNIEYKGAILSA